MIEGFDKEIDALLRQTAKSGTAPVKNPESQPSNPKSFHLDADEISAFAENALPEKTKLKYTKHFADCNRCRKILSNTIAINSETEIETASSVVSPQIADTTTVPWYRKLFAFPNSAYAMGALVILFGGFFAFLVVRNINEATSSADVSQISEPQQNARGPSFDGGSESTTENAMSDALSKEISSNTAFSGNTVSNTIMSNSASTSAIETPSVSNNSADNSAARTPNANAAVAQPPRATTAPPAAPEIAQAAPAPPAATFSTEAAGRSAAPISEKDRKAADKQTDAEKAEALQEEARSDSSASSARNTPSTTGNVSDSPKTKALRKQSSGAENRQIGGKTFTRREDVWYDASYNGQATTNVSRGSGDYQKLDTGLRSIAGNLSGTIVVVWKNKAYRIQ